MNYVTYIRDIQKIRNGLISLGSNDCSSYYSSSRPLSDLKLQLLTELVLIPPRRLRQVREYFHQEMGPGVSDLFSWSLLSLLNVRFLLLSLFVKVCLWS